VLLLVCCMLTRTAESWLYTYTDCPAIRPLAAGSGKVTHNRGVMQRTGDDLCSGAALICCCPPAASQLGSIHVTSHQQYARHSCHQTGTAEAAFVHDTKSMQGCLKTVLISCCQPSSAVQVCQPPYILLNVHVTHSIPVTTPSPLKLLLSMPKSLQRCSTNVPLSKKLPGSSSTDSRSRAVSFPFLCCTWMRFSPPPYSRR
jgi:hypothetical protein